MTPTKNASHRETHSFLIAYLFGRSIAAFSNSSQLNRCPQRSQYTWYSRSIVIPQCGHTGNV